MQHQKGLTMMEVLIVLVIVSILTALITFAGTKIKRSIQIRNSIGKLQQIYVVVSTYRTDWDGDGYTNYSHPHAYYGLGMPSLSYYELNRFGFDVTFFESPCNYNESVFYSFLCGFKGWITYVAPLYEPASMQPGSGNLVDFRNYLSEYRENSVLFVDPYCNEPCTSMSAKYLKKRGIALLLSGQIVNRYDYGNASAKNLRWYSEKPDI
jgi:prepilin-type N-terminal cleavage/methylation domain-containing protein